jgi:hypothetical protein
MLSLLWEFKLLQERSLRAELLLSQVQTPGARRACMQQAAILQQQHKQQKQKLSEAPRRIGRKPSNTPEHCNFAYF